jgi:DnaK suppressor protein
MVDNKHHRRRRQRDLRTQLEKRYRELASQVKGTIREARADGATTRAAIPLTAESDADVDAHVHGDIDLTIAQLKGDLLGRVAAALARLDEGRYGFCSECGHEIPEARLQALPFAVRCRACETTREDAARVKPASNRERILRAMS